jgi:hypothetical protein
MADATLIQGAKELAAAKSGIAPGAAFQAGFDKGQAKTQANLASQAKAQQARNKANMKSFELREDFIKEFAINTVTTLDSAGGNNITEADLQYAEKGLLAARAMILEGANMDAKARKEGSSEGYIASREMGAKGNAAAKKIYDQMLVMGKMRNAYTTLANEDGNNGIAVLPGNESRQAQMNVLLSQPWDIVDGALTFEDGTRLIDMKIPFAANIGIDFMEYASKETQAMAKLTPQEYAKAPLIKKEQENIIESFFEGDEGFDRLEVLVSDDYFKELNPGFSGINFDRNNPDEARKQATELTLAALASGTKPDKNAEGKATGKNNPVYADMKALQAEYLNTPLPNRAVRFTEDERVFTLGSKNTEVTLKKDGWYLQSKQPDGMVLMTRYTDVDDLLTRNSNLFN